MEIVSTTCTSAVLIMTAVFLGLEIAASIARALVVKMQLLCLKYVTGIREMKVQDCFPIRIFFFRQVRRGGDLSRSFFLLDFS